MHKAAGRRRIRGRARFHAANASTGTQEPFRWLMDTGSGFDLMSKKKLSNDDKKHVHWASSIITLLTANGKKQVDKAVKMMCSAMHEVIDPLLLDDTPSVLSIVRRCEKYGYQFHWDAFSSKPYPVKPNGDVIVLYTEHYVPFLDQEESKSDPNNYTGVIAPSIVVRDTASSQTPTSDGSNKKQNTNIPAAPADGDAAIPKVMSKTDKLIQDRDSAQHHMLHLPKNPLCAECNEAKVKTRHAKRNTGNLKEKFPNFGDCITSDTWHATGKHPTAGHA